MNATHAKRSNLPSIDVLPPAPSPGDVLRAALQQGRDPEFIRELMQLQREWEAGEARKAYVADMAEFKAGDPLAISKDKHVSYQTRSKNGEPGKTVDYWHASIGNVVGVIVSRLAQHGFSHAWVPEQKDGLIYVTCVITHRLGHSERTTMFAPPDDSGGKNPIQAISSSTSYLERYTLLAATGLATEDQEDDDGGRTKNAKEPTLEEKEIAEKAASVMRDWLAAIDECTTLDELASRRTELKGKFGGTDKVPETLRAACLAKKTKLEIAASNAGTPK
jgi:hypothetical protein